LFSLWCKKDALAIKEKKKLSKTWSGQSVRINFTGGTIYENFGV